MKLLMVTFSDNADHQDTAFGIYEQISQLHDTYLLAINNPKVPIKKTSHTWLVDCPERPGICRKTFNVSLLFSLVRRIRKEQFDVIFFESLHVWNLPCAIFAKAKTRTYQVIHEVIPHEGDRQETMVHLMNKAVCRCMDIIVLRNKRYLKDMVNRYHIEESRVKWQDLWRRYPSKTEPAHSKRVLFFGRINPYKGADNLLEIVRLCPDIQFDVVGRVDEQMEDVAHKLKKESNVHLNNNYVSDEEMRHIFCQSDWVILPYNSASQSGVIIDAYKYARPVIAFRVGAVEEQIVDGKSGYLVNAGDIGQFADKLKEAVGMPEDEYNKFSSYAYEYGSSRYAAEGAVERFNELINE